MGGCQRSGSESAFLCPALPCLAAEEDKSEAEGGAAAAWQAGMWVRRGSLVIGVLGALEEEQTQPAAIFPPTYI